MEKHWVRISIKGREFTTLKHLGMAGNVLRDATADEIAQKEAEIAALEARAAIQRERETHQDWQDAAYIMGALDHERESAIAKIGPARLAEIAELLRKP